MVLFDSFFSVKLMEGSTLFNNPCNLIDFYILGLDKYIVYISKISKIYNVTMSVFKRADCKNVKNRQARVF